MLSILRMKRSRPSEALLRAPRAPIAAWPAPWPPEQPPELAAAHRPGRPRATPHTRERPSTAGPLPPAAASAASAATVLSASPAALANLG
eukprot:14503205-Alexandrium_andersonii.AAC.1